MMSDIEFALVSIFTVIGIIGLFMFVGIKFILKYLSDIIEELRKLNQNKDGEINTTT
tara:strand:- start:7 stop:177 length:171 start_codon:yes stop_codon:yes gene_type:complete